MDQLAAVRSARTARSLLVLAPVLLALGVQPGCAAPRWPVAPVEPRERLVDITHYEIHVELDPLAGHLDGQVVVFFEGLGDAARGVRGTNRLLELDAVEMDIHGVWDGAGNELAYEYDGRLLAIELAAPVAPGEPASVSVQYGCYPRRGLYIVPPSAQEGGRPWHVWTQGQSEETRHWVPVRDIPDEMASHELHVTVPDALLTMAAGELRGQRDHRDGLRTDHWHMATPHVSYLITLVAGAFGLGHLEGGPVPLPVVAEAEDLPLALENLAETGAMLDLMAEYLDEPYPYVKYAQCCVKEYTGGGMENISATTLYYRTIHDPADEPQVDSVPLVAHEAAHQWFGDLLTCASWAHIWLNEGFSNYLEDLYLGRTRGADVAAHERLSAQRATVRAELADSRPIVWHDYERPDDVFSEHAYDGGAARLHLLESVLGERVFRRGLREYVDAHKGGTVTTDDLRRALQRASGQDLTRFFEEWLLERGFPHFRVSIAESQPITLDGEPVRVLTGDVSHVTALTIEQTQRDLGWREVFHVPVTVTWSRGGVVQHARLEIENRVERLFLTGNGALDWVRFDADTSVPMLLDMRQDESLWRRQLTLPEDGVTRLLAAEWFAGHELVHPDLPEDWQPAEESFAALLGAAERDPFVPVRLAALDALVRVRDPRVFTVLERAVLDGDPRVRERAARGLAQHGNDAALPLLYDAVDDPNASVVEAALGALVTRESPAAFAQLERVYAATEPIRWRLDRAIVRLVARLDDDERALPFLMSAARAHVESRVRAAAMAALTRQAGGHDDVVHRVLCEGLDDASYRVRAAAAGALGARGQSRARIHLEARRAIEIDPSVLGAIDAALERLPLRLWGAGA